MHLKKLPIITIDGPAGVGKSTLAKAMACALQWPYLDTGAMFRAMALRLGPGAESLPEAELAARCGQIHFALEKSRDGVSLFCNGNLIGDEIRTETVGKMASLIATNPVVRECLKKAQRAIGESTCLVAEGRDMGTVVFPQARFKFFLDASPEIRAERRCRELVAQGQSADVQAIAAQIYERDVLDRNRAVAPLCAAEDAKLIDTSYLSIDEVLATMLAAVQAGGCA